MCVVCLYCTAGIVGELDGEEVSIWTHKKFDIGYNGKHIVDVNLTSESKVKLQPNIQLKFTYEVLLAMYPSLLRGHPANLALPAKWPLNVCTFQRIRGYFYNEMR